MKTVRLDCGPEAIRTAAGILNSGGLVAFPTETVYGLGADANNTSAIESLFAAKRRPACNPLIVHVANRESAEALVEFDELAGKAAELFWPGPLTLVLPRRRDSLVSNAVGGGRPTLAVRMPSHPVAIDLVAGAGVPVAAPSANPSGCVSPTTADHVAADLDGRISAILDGGACPLGLESTVIRTWGNGYQLLRPGALPQEALMSHLGLEPTHLHGHGEILSPGQLPIHYAPRSPVRMNASTAGDGEVMLGFGPGHDPEDLNLSPSGDLNEAAARLFELLRLADGIADRRGFGAIAVAPVPESGIGRAINDRLRRASSADSGVASA